LYGEIQMANTTFSGPIRAGNIPNTTGTTVGTNVANVGQVVMGQSVRFTQNALFNTTPNTTIVIPANSQIVEITLYIDAALTGTTTLTLGTSALATAFTASGAVTGSAVGIVSVTPGTDATRTDAFINVGTTDVRIAVTAGSAGSGSGAITVRYLQNINVAIS
jgi:hypothetical protein